MEKLISRTALRKQIGEALKPIRTALHSSEDGAHVPVEFMGYRFTGCRLYQAPGRTGFAWYCCYDGEPITEELQAIWPVSTFGRISGGIDACADQMHSRLRKQALEVVHG